MHRLQPRYEASQRRLKEQSSEAASGLDLAGEADSLAQRFDLARRKRSASEYAEVADYLLNRYPPELAYFVSVQINEQLEPRLGYPPIGQIMRALEARGGEGAARWIGCAFRNFPRVETAQLAFGVIPSITTTAVSRAKYSVDAGGFFRSAISLY